METSTCAGFIEHMGLLWETEGLPRIAGRIFGYLVIQPEPCSLDDLAAGLGVSKASISTDARRLEQLGLIVRVSRPGDRRDYYSVDPDAPASGLEVRLRTLKRFERCLAETTERDKLHPAVRDRLERFEYAHYRLVGAMEQVIAELRNQGSTPALPPDTQ